MAGPSEQYSDRLSGLFFLLLGLTVFFYINPTQIESVDGGNLSPGTFPNILAIVIAACGAFLLFKPGANTTPEVRSFVITGSYVAVLAGSLYAMSIFGFEYVAPVLALVIMLGIGERRLFWLALGVVGMPTLIGFMVTHVLGRALP